MRTLPLTPESRQELNRKSRRGESLAEMVVVMSVIVALKVFAVPQLMTNGGPAGATNVVPLQIYKTGFEFFRMGKASAMSMFLFAVMMVFSIVQIRLFSAAGETQ